jgi:4-amino-4-deoxy-L-arabinose transferase-like glycosyltransferase
VSLHAADPREKKRTLWVVAGIVILAVAATWWYLRWSSWINVLLSDNQYERVRMEIDTVLRSVQLLLSACCLGAAALLAQIVIRSHQQNRFPPKEARLLRTMKIYEGEAKSPWLLTLGVLAALLVIASGLAFPWQSLFG